MRCCSALVDAVRRGDGVLLAEGGEAGEAKVFNLLQAKRDEIAAYRGYIEAVRDYWIARTELERAVAAPLETK